MNQKGFIGIALLIIVGLAIILGGGYYVTTKMRPASVVQVPQQAVTQTTDAIASSSSPAQTPTIAMKTYSGGFGSSGFRFTYPASFTLKEYPVDYDQSGYATWSVALSSSTNPFLNVDVTEEASPDAVANCTNDTYNDKFSDVPGTPIVRNGITFYAGTTEDQGAGSIDYGSVDAVAHNGNCYEISSDVHASTQESSSQITLAEQDGQSLVDEIASTFQFTTVEPGAGGGPDSGGAPGMSGGSGACQMFAHLKLGDTDSSVGGQQVSALQMDLGVTPATGVYGPKTQIAYENECGGTNVPPISVAGMSRYIDTDFSFWYPSGWAVTAQATSNADQFSGGTVEKTLLVQNSTDPQNGIIITQVNAPTSITISGHLASPTYYFVAAAGTWMTYDSSNQNPVAANLSTNTMGGLHMFFTGAVFTPTVIPLSSMTFLVIGDPQAGIGRTDALAKTIVATDPSVGLRESTAQQTATIQAEQQAYAGQ